MAFFQNIFRGGQRPTLEPLYRAIVERGRDPFWYRDGRVPDTLDGRFDMIAALVALVLLRIEAEGEAAAPTSILLTEAFIDDMDASLRQIGIGDYVVGKHVGRMVGALGGRLGAFREAQASGSGFADAVRRNVFHEAPPSPEALALVAERLERFGAALATTSVDRLAEGHLP